MFTTRPRANREPVANLISLFDGTVIDVSLIDTDF
jgi:hypothetical protein